MKKICFVIDSLYNSGGMEHSMSILAGALSTDYKVTVVTGMEEGKPLFYPLNNAVKYVDLGVNTKLKKKFSFVHPITKNYKNKLASFLTSNPQDDVVCLGGISQYFLPDIKDSSKKIFWFKFQINIFKAWSVNEGIVRRHIESFMQKFRMIYHARKFDRLVVLTDHDKLQWSKYLHNAIRIYNPLTLDVPPQLSDCTAKQVIAVGNLDYVKGFDMLIQSWALLIKGHEDWRLVIYGQGKERESLTQLIKKLHLEPYVCLAGVTKEIVSKYTESSIFILSSREEGFGNVMVEAEACGLPIIAFDCPYGPGEIVEDGRNGYLVPLGDIKTMAVRIRKLMDDDNLRKTMGKRSLEVVEKFSLPEIKRKWMEIL